MKPSHVLFLLYGAAGDEEVYAALDINIPNYVSGIVTTTEIVDSISSL